MLRHLLSSRVATSLARRSGGLAHQARNVHSLLFCPGNKKKVITKALTLNTDAVVMDFEDAVAASEKENAREVAVAACREFRETAAARRRPIVAIRINEPTLDVGAGDVEFLRRESDKAFTERGEQLFACDAVVVPKCENVDVVKKVSEDLGERAPPLWCMIETSRGILEANSIAALPNVEGPCARPDSTAHGLISVSCHRDLQGLVF